MTRDNEKEERQRLEACLKSIDENLTLIAGDLSRYSKDVQSAKDHMWEARRDMDHIDKIAIRQAVEQKMRSAEVLKERHMRLQKLRSSPYFGRFDFSRSTPDADVTPIYVGVHDFRDETTGTTKVYDWRAPISSLFYDYETGPASYQAPGGEIHGHIGLKRQFRITNGKMELMLNSGINIVDDVLQEELSRASDDGMKNIVSTIQRDQNAIIRDGEAQNLIIQGVAGSGKTSIALHRIAFLLYRFKDTLNSGDILIISPNKVFASYIGNVLPELGEEQVPEIGMGELADQLLDGKFRFQSLFEQISDLLEGKDQALTDRIAMKSSLDFLRKIDAYVDHLEASSFAAAEWRSGLNRIVPAWHFAETWARHRMLPYSQRLTEVVETTEHKVFLHYKHELRRDERKSLRDAVRAMTKPQTLRSAYKGLFEWLGEPEFFKPRGSKLEYSDVFPLIYMKMKLEGLNHPYKAVKHLLVDEMQDYSPVHYAVLERVFPCRKTILGDATQSVNPVGGSDAEAIQKILKASRPVKLTRSYRSTWEIMQFALGISPNDEMVPMKRHGEAPKVVTTTTAGGAVAQVIEELKSFHQSIHRTLAVICKTQKEARALHRDLLACGVDIQLIELTSTGYATGAIICTAHLAKGLEFDRVVVANAGADVYSTQLDRNLLYVACTRAMHRLTVIVVGEPSALLPEKPSTPEDHAYDGPVD